MTAITITTHATQRWIERVDPGASFEQARAAIARHESAVLAASRFGCKTVKLGNGARFILDGATIITVIARGQVRLIPGMGRARA